MNRNNLNHKDKNVNINTTSILGNINDNNQSRKIS